MLFVWSCGEQIRTDNAFIIATYDDVKDWDPATAFSLEVFPMSNIYEPLLLPALTLVAFYRGLQFPIQAVRMDLPGALS